MGYRVAADRDVPDLGGIPLADLPRQIDDRRVRPHPAQRLDLSVDVAVIRVQVEEIRLRQLDCGGIEHGSRLEPQEAAQVRLGEPAVPLEGDLSGAVQWTLLDLHEQAHAAVPGIDGHGVRNDPHVDVAVLAVEPRQPLAQVGAPLRLVELAVLPEPESLGLRLQRLAEPVSGEGLVPLEPDLRDLDFLPFFDPHDHRGRVRVGSRSLERNVRQIETLLAIQRFDVERRLVQPVLEHPVPRLERDLLADLLLVDFVPAFQLDARDDGRLVDRDHGQDSARRVSGIEADVVEELCVPQRPDSLLRGSRGQEGCTGQPGQGGDTRGVQERRTLHLDTHQTRRVLRPGGGRQSSRCHGAGDGQHPNPDRTRKRRDVVSPFPTPPDRARRRHR